MINDNETCLSCVCDGFLAFFSHRLIHTCLTWLITVQKPIFTTWPIRPKGYCRCLCLSIRPSVRQWNLLCPHDNSSQIWARITKFALNMHPGILSVGIENRGHWHWSSKLFWPFWLRILGNSACPRDNSWQTWVGITKLAPNAHHGKFSAGFENRGHWPWPSRSFWPFWLRILGYLACLHNDV